MLLWVSFEFFGSDSCSCLSASVCRAGCGAGLGNKRGQKALCSGWVIACLSLWVQLPWRAAAIRQTQIHLSSSPQYSSSLAEFTWRYPKHRRHRWARRTVKLQGAFCQD